MATGNDLTELASLLKLERKAQRRQRRGAATPTVDPTAKPDAGPRPEPRFADFFRPWSEYTAADAKDVELFRAAVSDAVPLKHPQRAEPKRVKPPPHARFHGADEADALQASREAMYPSPMSWDIGADIEDEQSFLRGGVSPELLRKLRRGQWTINAEIDLHHHNQDEAYEALLDFMRKARAAGWRCVRVIHGKGLSSHQKIPVLRAKVRRWLQQKDEVLAYCEPRPNGGGSGAVLVLLRGHAKSA